MKLRRWRNERNENRKRHATTTSQARTKMDEQYVDFFSEANSDLSDPHVTVQVQYDPMSESPFFNPFPLHLFSKFA